MIHEQYSASNKIFMLDRVPPAYQEKSEWWMMLEKASRGKTLKIGLLSVLIMMIV